MDANWVRGKNYQRADRSVFSSRGELGAAGRVWLWAPSCGWAVSVEQVGAAALAHALYSFIFHASFSALPDLWTSFFLPLGLNLSSENKARV